MCLSYELLVLHQCTLTAFPTIHWESGFHTPFSSPILSTYGFTFLINHSFPYLGAVTIFYYPSWFFPVPTLYHVALSSSLHISAFYVHTYLTVHRFPCLGAVANFHHRDSFPTPTRHHVALISRSVPLLTTMSVLTIRRFACLGAVTIFHYRDSFHPSFCITWF